MGNDYKTIDKPPNVKKNDNHERLKKRLKLAVAAMIFLPLVYFMLINFVLGLHVPEQMYAILGILYIAIFVIIIFMSLTIPHT